MALLHAYFDESGIHAGAPATIIAGFIGPADEWKVVRDKWTVAMRGEVFHYKNMRPRKELLDELAGIMGNSKLQVIAGGFIGDWMRAISAGTDWKIRFPSVYHYIFELCVEQMDRWASTHWGDDPIALVFSRQKEYAKRAEEVWRTHRGNGFWGRFASFAYGEPECLPELQTADMVAYETYQCIGKDDDVWCQWPLMKRLLQGNITLLGGHQTTDSFIEMMKKGDREGRTYLKIVPKA